MSREGKDKVEVRIDVCDNIRYVRAQRNRLKTAIFHEISSLTCEGKKTSILHLHEAWWKEHREALPFMEEKIYALENELGPCFGRYGFSEEAIRAAFNGVDEHLVNFMQTRSSRNDPFPDRWEDDEPDIHGKRPIQVFKDKYWLWLTHYTTTVVAIQGDRLLVAGGGSFAVFLVNGKQERILNPRSAGKPRAGTVLMDTLKEQQPVILTLQSQNLVGDLVARTESLRATARGLVSGDLEDGTSAVAIVLERLRHRRWSRSRSPSSRRKH